MEEKVPYKVLVVDDVAENVQIVSDYLYDKGIAVTVARNGKQALKSVGIKQPDIILLDIAMPEMDGFEVCEVLKKDPLTQNIPIIFLTAKTEMEDVIHGFKLGAVDYITKPFNLNELYLRVTTHLELKRSRDVIFDQNEKLKQSEITKDKIFSIIANDLKYPFRNILDIINFLLENYSTMDLAKIKTRLTEMQEQGKKANVLFERLVEWSNILRNKISYRPTTFDAVPLVTKIINEFKHAADHKGIHLIFEKQEKRNLYCDAYLLEVVIKNLISNAIKYTNTGGDIIVSLKYALDFVEINVYDTGIGIAPEIKDNLFKFEKYYSTKGTANETGIGLGLVVCKKYVEKFGGKIWVESMPGIGSDFKFTVPSKHFDD